MRNVKSYEMERNGKFQDYPILWNRSRKFIPSDDFFRFIPSDVEPCYLSYKVSEDVRVFNIIDLDRTIKLHTNLLQVKIETARFFRVIFLLYLVLLLPGMYYWIDCYILIRFPYSRDSKIRIIVFQLKPFCKYLMHYLLT